MPEVLKDTKKCIELYPTFYKGCTRKGAILFVSKECDKARERVFLSATMEKVKIPVKVLLDAMMHQLGLPNAVYSTQKGADGRS